jgi:hypothetical protein
MEDVGRRGGESRSTGSNGEGILFCLYGTGTGADVRRLSLFEATGSAFWEVERRGGGTAGLSFT